MTDTFTRPKDQLDIDAQPSPPQRVDTWLSEFEAALSARDSGRAAQLFAVDSYWRDLVAFTWNLKTVEGRSEIADMLSARVDDVHPSGFHTLETPEDADGVIAARIAFETSVGRCEGHVRLRIDDADGGGDRAWTLLTTLQELKGHEEGYGPTRPMGVTHGADKDRMTWTEEKEREDRELGYSQQPYVLIVGGGQGGIALGARMRQLRVPTIVIDSHARPGDQWRGRYKSLCLHDPVWYDHLPYLPFPPNWPVFTPKDKVGDWLEMYTKVMEVPYWSSTTATSAAYDETAGEWLVHVERDGQPLTLRPRHLVMATGMSGKPNIPRFPGAESFRGDQHHSSQHPGPDRYQGKKVVVIGANNSAHDICGALWEHDVDVTMVQRSSTHIVKSASFVDLGLGDLYSERAVAAGMTTHKADLALASMPYHIMHEFQIPIYDKIRERDADFYDRLAQAGFEHDWGDDGSGLFMKYLRRGSGYYIDVGAGDLVANGDIKLARGGVQEITGDSVVLDNGTTLPADVIVYATGYGSMNGWVADLIDQKTADKVGKVWGLGSDTTKDPGPWEGEERNMWKPTQQENLWFHGGNLHQSRHYSRYLALQLKARYEGMETPVYALQEVHHVS